MKKKITIPILLLILTFLGCAASDSAEKIESKSFDFINSNAECQQRDYRLFYDTVNTPIFNNSLDRIGLTEQEVGRYSEDIKKPFIGTANAESIIPPELIGVFEKVLYDYKLDYNGWGFAESYNRAVQQLGADNCQVSLDDLYSLFPEINEHKSDIKQISDAYKYIQNPQNCYSVFRLPMKSDGDYYVVEYQSGGTNGGCSVQLINLLDGKQILINEFEIQNYGAGAVIQYKNNYYYVFIQYNYNLKTDDGIRIHKLGAYADIENILIRYLPEKYSWRNIYDVQSDCKYELDQYIDSIRDLIATDYLDNGIGGVSLLIGDEVEVDDESLKINGMEWRIDFANSGVPVYLAKGLCFPDTAHGSLFLMANFYVYDSQTDSSIELTGLKLDRESSEDIRLIQLWFKEINGEVFTFRIYHISSYNYVLTVSLIEGDKITQIRTDLLLAQKKFVLTEGEKFRLY